METRLSCFACENKSGGHFTRFKSKNTAGTRRNNSKKQQEDNLESDICYLENICGARQNLNVPAIEDEINIDVISITPRW